MKTRTFLMFYFALALTGAIATLTGVAHAQPADAGAAVADAGPAAPHADQLPDPVSHPAAAFDEIKAAKKLGWPIVAFVALMFAAKAAGRLGKSVAWLAWLGRGKAAVVVGAAGALGASCYDAATSGGSWMAILFAGVMAVGHYVDAGKA